jgi:hypothetical protein
LYIQGFPQFDGGLDYGMTLPNPIGLKDENWWQDTGGFAGKSNAEWTANAEVYLNRPDMPRAYESAWGRWLMGGAQGTYWMLLAQISHGPPAWVDWHSDHFQTLAEYPWLSPWFIKYLGVDVHTSPGGFVALRDIQESAKKEARSGNSSEQYGDFSWLVYRLEDEPGAHTVAIPYTELPAVAQQQLYTNINPKDRLGNPSPAMTARRTDSVSGNTLMAFDIDSGLIFGTGSYTVRVVYLDQYIGNFSIQWVDGAGAIRDHWITRTNSGLWKEETFSITNASDGFGTFDIRAWTGGGPDITLHLLEVLKD